MWIENNYNMEDCMLQSGDYLFITFPQNGLWKQYYFKGIKNGKAKWNIHSNAKNVDNLDIEAGIIQSALNKLREPDKALRANQIQCKSKQAWIATNDMEEVEQAPYDELMTEYYYDVLIEVLREQRAIKRLIKDRRKAIKEKEIELRNFVVYCFGLSFCFVAHCF